MGRQIGAAFQLGQDQKYADISAEFGRARRPLFDSRPERAFDLCGEGVDVPVVVYDHLPEGPVRSSRAVVALATA